MAVRKVFRHRSLSGQSLQGVTKTIRRTKTWKRSLLVAGSDEEAVGATKKAVGSVRMGGMSMTDNNET